MAQKSFVEGMELVQSDLASGLAAFELIYDTLSEQKPLDNYIEALFVLYTYLRGVHHELDRLIQAFYQEKEF